MTARFAAMDALPWRVVYEVLCPEVALGDHRFDIRHRAVVMGIVHRTPEGQVAAALADAEQLVAEGADVISVEGTDAEEPGHLVATIEAISSRFDGPIAVSTGRAAVLRSAIAAGAVVGIDSSGFADPDFLAVAAAGSASVIAVRTGPVCEELVVDAVSRLLRHRAEQAEAAGIPRDRVVVDAGVALGEVEPHSFELLRGHDRLAGLGWPLSLTAELGGGREASHAARALGIALGCRILRARDVKGARRTADVMAAVLEARAA